ncbi:GYD domain-containing protein [Hoeflea prorocentri]|uniref:GYD domain-containing protein n=1 Tax=Hoeflea prorocentri TaxID=1922333 RepID=A0A9X3UK65_9HYPH|nr:GYD domain-containing protein [Hoeflea prorocentri]MCY6382164.1 GYD domain-containing protein [Hoeflea prorocentri]MDA5399964.1 GYD domain-containing protein [Hoeflea prorocentri]
MTVMVALFIKYENDKKAKMLKTASDRAAVSDKAVAAMGGKLLHAYGTCGEFDMMFIYEMPDMASVATNMMLADASGMSKYHKIIPLFSNDDFVAAQKRAGAMTDSYSAVDE